MTRRAEQMSADDRRDQVLGVAEVMFAEHGYHHVSMDDLADRADVSKPVLYRHFPSKLDLYLAVIDRRGEVLLAEVENALAQAPSAGSGLDFAQAVISAFVRFVDESGQASSLLFRSDVTRNEAVRDRVEYAVRETARAVRQALDASTGLPAAQVDLLAEVLVGMAQTCAVSATRSRVDDPVDVVARLAWRGVHDFVTMPT